LNEGHQNLVTPPGVKSGEIYWRIGRLILERQRTQPWGSAVIRRLALDLRREFPDMTGLSATNLQYMRAFAAAWPDFPTGCGKLPRGHIRTLLQLNDLTLRDWYAERDAVNGWSRQVLEHHIATGLHRRVGSAPSNFVDHLDPVDADQAQEIVKDPYVFDFLDLAERSRERAIETALTERLQDTLAELGPGFAFVGRLGEAAGRLLATEGGSTPPVVRVRCDPHDPDSSGAIRQSGRPLFRTVTA
jgi:predicted nuclease of restriction endonuclease-like (RecB) superfamily